MDLKLAGRRALVTGSTAGIGYAIAETLAREGTAVTLNGRDQGRLDAALARVRAAAPDAILDGIVADVTTEDGAARIKAHLPEIDVLVNNVAIFTATPFFDSTDALWREAFDVSVMSGVRLSRLYGQGMRARGWGRIIFVSSESAFNIPVEFIHYGVAKLAQIGVARGLAIELKGSGVTVNSVLPGPSSTERQSIRMAARVEAEGRSVEELTAEFFDKRRPTSLLRRYATPQEAANLVAFVAGDGAAAITGAALRVEGGIVSHI